MSASSALPKTKWIYDFAEGSREMRDLLGGKGANVAEMTRVLGAELRARRLHDHHRGVRRVHARGRIAPDGLREAVDEALARLEERAGRRLGDPADPLLVSVRSGARDSMPGMMDTVLNLGLNDASVEGLAARTGNAALRLGLLPAARADVRRRRARHPRRALRGGDRAHQARARRDARHRARRRRAARAHAPLPGALRLPEPTRASSSSRRSRPSSTPGWASAPSPTGASTASPTTGAPRSTSSRWSSATRARRSASGVAFSRDEVTGAPEPSGDFLVDAQGEDVVSGVRTPRDLHELGDWMPAGPRRSCGRSCARSSATTRTCRTPSSRSRRGACTCSRRATPSARPRRRCASPSTPSRRAC